MYALNTANNSLLQNCTDNDINNSLFENCITDSVDFAKHDYSDALAMEQMLEIIIPVLFSVISFISIFENSLVIIVISFNTQLRSATNILILNLAVADLFFVIFCIPFTAFHQSISYWSFGDVSCRVVQYFIIVCTYASIYTLVLMSLDRFLAVVHPVTAISIRTERNACLAIFSLWSIIFLSCIPALQSHGVVSYIFANYEYSVCVFSATEGYNYFAFHLSFFFSSYVIPLILIFCLYTLMLKRLWFGAVPRGRVSSHGIKRKKRITCMVVVAVITFACCWCPLQIVLVLKSVGQFELNKTNIAIQITSQVLAYMNSGLNPIIYGFLSDNLRKAFRKVIICNPQNA